MLTWAFHARQSLIHMHSAGLLGLHGHLNFPFLRILLSSADNLCKQFGSRSGPTKHWSWSGSNLFDTLIVFLKEFFEKVNFGKSQQTTANSMENYPVCVEVRENLVNEPWHEISNNVVCATSKASDQPAHMRSLIWGFACLLNIIWLLSYWLNIIWAVTWDFEQCGMCDQQSLRSAWAYSQSDQSLCLSLEYSMTVKLLTRHHLEFQSLKGGCTGLSESTLVKMPHCWKSHVMAQMGSNAWVKVFRIIPEFRILKLTFHRKSASKCWIRDIIVGFLIYISLSKDNWPFKFEIVNSGHTASFKIGVWKVQDFGHFELPPMQMSVISRDWRVRYRVVRSQRN